MNTHISYLYGQKLESLNYMTVWRPLPGEPLWIFAQILYCQKLESFLLLIVWVYLHSNFCGGLQKAHLFSNRVCIGRSWSSKVVEFGNNQKGVCDFLLVISSNFGPILHSFWDTATYWLKIVNFSYPISFNTLAQGEPFRISAWIFFPKTRVLGLSVRFRDPSFRHFHSVPACDRQTDGQADRHSDDG